MRQHRTKFLRAAVASGAAVNSKMLRNAVITLGVLAVAAALATSARSGTAGTRSAAWHWIASVTPSDINDRGQVVGEVTKEYDGSTVGFVWKRGSLRVFGRGQYAGASLINERGQILGWSGGHAVLWQKGRARTVGLESVSGLNEAGQVFGGTRMGNDTDGYSTVPAVWTNGTVRSLPLASAAAMNDLGQVVGQTADGRAAEWQDGKLTDLGAGNPIAVNDRGDILGSLGEDVILWHDGTPTDIGQGRPVALNEHGEAIVTGQGGISARAFLWRNGTLTDIGTLGGDWAVPTAISDRGQVVGTSIDSRGRQHGFVWQNGIMTRLPAPPGYGGSITQALAINDRNQIIGDNCSFWCSESRTAPPSKFAVLWTLRGDRVEARRIVSRRDSRRRLG